MGDMRRLLMGRLAKLSYEAVTTNPFVLVCITNEIEDVGMFQEFQKKIEEINDIEKVNVVWAFYCPGLQLAVTVNGIGMCSLKETKETLGKRHITFIGAEDVDKYLKEKDQLTKRISRGILAIRCMEREDLTVIDVALTDDAELNTALVSEFAENPEYSDIVFNIVGQNLYIGYKKEESAPVDKDGEEAVERIKGFVNLRRQHHKNTQKNDKDDEDGKALDGGFSKEAVDMFNANIKAAEKECVWDYPVFAYKEFPDLAGMRFGPGKEFPMMRYFPPQGKRTAGIFANLDILARLAGQLGIYPQEFGGTAYTCGRMYTIAATVYRLCKAIRVNKNYRVRVCFEEENWPYGSVKEGLAEVSKWYNCDVEEVGWLTFELTPKKAE